eukprot:TRINITY_DN12753_c0_g1_i6.p2 TRINITY_DN12753_c0_g1~~TRINITY_DN12753_c0_g1_i6.p2  ORF type:complete len:127 (+),score=30.79 TRINITY_DN12753_c0_g1_i6:65-445(+)
MCIRDRHKDPLNYLRDTDVQDGFLANDSQRRVSFEERKVSKCSSRSREEIGTVTEVTNHLLANGEHHTGKLVNSKRTGEGTTTYPNGDHYTGQWKSDLYEGRGTLVRSTGERYEGCLLYTSPSPRD